jgi:hypothetical protein
VVTEAPAKPAGPLSRMLHLVTGAWTLQPDQSNAGG